MGNLEDRKITKTTCDAKSIFVGTSREQRERLAYVIVCAASGMTDENGKTIRIADADLNDDKIFGKISGILNDSFKTDKKMQILQFAKCDFNALLIKLRPIFRDIPLNNVRDLYNALAML